MRENEGSFHSQDGSARGVEQAGDGAVHLLVLAFAIMLEYDLSALVDDVLRRPILIAIGVPGLRVVVLRNRVADAVAFQRRCTLDADRSNGNSGV